jgi:chorismate dehydratase
VVSYLNSTPFIYGLDNFFKRDDVKISIDIPSICAEKLLSGQADIGLVPVAILPRLNHYSIISDYCIAANGEVSSVLLLSDVPLEKIETILLDYQSRTSVMLTRILTKKLWGIHPQWKETSENYEKDIRASTAGVVIGDRALKLKGKFKYVYDLSAEWNKLTGLPFVFACWVSTIETTPVFNQEFNNALYKGISDIEAVVQALPSKDINPDVAIDYLKNNISFLMDDKMKKGMKRFLEFVEQLSI